MIRQPYVEQCPRAYLRTSRTAHLLPPLSSLNTYVAALCGTCPDYTGTWRGTGSQREIETVASLPLCKRCEKQARAHDEAAARIAELGRQERASCPP